MMAGGPTPTSPARFRQCPRFLLGFEAEARKIGPIPGRRRGQEVCRHARLFPALGFAKEHQIYTGS